MIGNFEEQLNEIASYIYACQTEIDNAHRETIRIVDEVFRETDRIIVKDFQNDQRRGTSDVTFFVILNVLVILNGSFHHIGGIGGIKEAFTNGLIYGILCLFIFYFIGVPYQKIHQKILSILSQNSNH